jgi:polygalacturonase
LYSSSTGIFNIYDYSVVPPDPTGVADSSRAINAAINVAESNGGGIVFVPPGTYAIAATIALADNVQLVGSSRGDTSITAMPGMLWI